MPAVSRVTGALFLVLLAWFMPGAAAGAVELQQPDGQTLRLEGPASRLVTLAPHLAELVFEAGAGDRLLATVAYSDYPEGARSLPRIGDAYRLDIEGILALRPDLVIAWDSGNPRAATAQLRGLGLDVWSIEIRQPDEIATMLRAIGRATGRPAQADAAATAFERRLAGLADRYTGAGTLDYFYQVDANPLFTIGNDHLISQGLALCGGRNVFGGEDGLAFQVSHEAVVAADPDALLAPRSPGQPDPLARWHDWPRMRAVATGALLTLDADRISRATSRWLDSIETACTLLHEPRR